MTIANLAFIDEREFEILCDDLVGRKLSVEVKRGKRGPDGGIDGFFPWDGGHGVVQAKHYLGTGFSGLFGKLKNEELQRARTIGARRYFLMTSCGLSPDNRKAIKELFGDLLAEEDIFSGDDICAALSNPENSEIVKNHYKPRLSRIFRDNLSRIFTGPLKTLGEKYFQTVPKPVETFRPSRPGLRPKPENRRRGAASQPKRRGQGTVRRADGLSVDDSLDPHFRFARHRALPASFRPSGRPRVVGHEMLRVTNAHENAIPPIANHIKRYSCGVFVSVRDVEGLSCSASRRGPGRVKWRGGSPRRSRR